jgi:hypothetical protein
MGRTTVVLVVLAMGCGGGNHDAPSGPCQPTQGTYRLSFTERSGSCGAISEMIRQYSVGTPMGGGPAASSCRVDLHTESPDCSVSYDVTCPGGEGTSVREVGIAHWAVDASSGTATEQITIFDPTDALVCSGDYDLRYQRL